MTKTINLEISKRLNEGWYLEGIETEYYFYKNPNGDFAIINHPDDPEWINGYKTLNLEEAIEFLPYQIQYKYDNWGLCITKTGKEYQVEYEHTETWETLLEAIEKMLTYLLDNDLLPKN